MVGAFIDAKFAGGIVSKITTLRDRVWKYFSEYIRLRDAINGYVYCTTCSKPTPVEQTHAGHFIHGKNSLTFFDEANVHPQCIKCNLFLSGNQINYTMWMLKKYGKKKIEKLQDESHKKHIWTKDELETLKEKYKNKLMELKHG